MSCHDDINTILLRIVTLHPQYHLQILVKIVTLFSILNGWPLLCNIHVPNTHVFPEFVIGQNLPEFVISQIPPEFVTGQIPPEFVTRQIPPEFVISQIPLEFGISQILPEFVTAHTYSRSFLQPTDPLHLS